MLATFLGAGEVLTGKTLPKTRGSDNVFFLMSATWHWIIFHLFLATALWIDLGVIHRRPETVTTRKALAWSAVWMSMAMLFCLGIYFVDGQHKSVLFLTGYLIEQS